MPGILLPISRAKKAPAMIPNPQCKKEQKAVRAVRNITPLRGVRRTAARKRRIFWLVGALATLNPAATISTICMEKESKFQTPLTQNLTMSKGP